VDLALVHGEVEAAEDLFRCRDGSGFGRVVVGDGGDVEGFDAEQFAHETQV